MRLVSSYTLMAVSQVVLLVGGVMSAAVTSQLLRAVPNKSALATLPRPTLLLLHGWMLWILVPVVWIALASWLTNRSRASEGVHTLLWLSGVALVITFGVWAVWGGFLPMLGAFDTPAARDMESITREQLGPE